MKGVVLAGGLGRRLWPITKVINKHLLPVYDKPMIYYPLGCLVTAGIRDVLLVTGRNDAGKFRTLLGNGKDIGLTTLYYADQEGEAGIADALRQAEQFADGKKIVVILGDNIVGKNILRGVSNFINQPAGARLHLKEVSDPHRFGVPVFDGDRITRIEEKPTHPTSRYAVTGIYMYDSQVFEFIRNLKPSARGEWEITDVNNMYIEKGLLEYEVLDGWWSDAGTPESLLRAANLVAENGANRVENAPDSHPSATRGTG